MAREQKTESLSLRLKPSVKKLLEQLADEDGYSVSVLIERLAKAEQARRLGERRSRS